MSLVSLRDRMSLVHCAIAVLTVVLGDGAPWWSVALAVACTAWAFVRPLPPEPSRRAARLWTLGIAVALVITLGRALFRLEFLDAGVDFLLLLIVQRMFNRQRAREHLQLLMLSSLLMVIGAVINAGLNFPILFALYLLAAVMTLLLNHLLAEGERLGRRVQVEVARAGIRSRRNLWRAAAGVAAIAGLGALVVFLVFPRWGAGVFLRGNIARDSHSGFSGTVQLGGFGRIKSDSTVVARLRPRTPVPPVPRLTWYLRGSALDLYERGNWTHGRDAERPRLEPMGPFRTFAPGGNRELQVVSEGPGREREFGPRPIPGFAASEERLWVQVILEDIGVDVLFAASEPLGVRVQPRGAIERRVEVRDGFNREFHADKPPGPIQYEFISRIGEPTTDELEAVGSPPASAQLEPYLQRNDALSPEVTELARRLTANARTRHQKVQAVLAHLAGFAYSTTLTESDRVRAGADPLEGFLFDTRAGHCEYFATAMAILLREVGVPTRIVNGYYGAHYNQLGDFYAVRQADAHSWVEVHFGPLGWVTFDPTPPSGRTAGDDAGLLPGLDQALDAMRNAYLEYVIDYNLTKQLALLEDLGVRRSGGPFGSEIDWKGVGLWFAGGVGLLLAAAWWRQRRRRRPDAEEVRLYAGLVSRFAARGHPRAVHESPQRYARRLHEAGVAGTVAFVTFADRYESLRFGRPLSPVARRRAVRELADLARAIRRTLRRGGRGVHRPLPPHKEAAP